MTRVLAKFGLRDRVLAKFGLRDRVLAKFGLRDRVQAVVVAYECGIVHPSSD